MCRYQKTFGEELVEQAVSNLVDVYERFVVSGLADTQFDSQLRSLDKNTHAQRLGEMLLFDRLQHAGFDLTSCDEGPDFRADKDGDIVWLELITPSTGEDVRISEIHTVCNPLEPSSAQTEELSQRLLLRVTAAIKEKRDKYTGYLKKGIVQPHEPCVIVVNDALLCPETMMYGISHGADHGEGGLPLVEHATQGIGIAYWENVGDTGQFELRHSDRETISTMKPPPAPVTVAIFGEGTDAESMRHVAAILQVTHREDYGIVMELRKRGGTANGLLHPGTLVTNSSAIRTLSASLSKSLLLMVSRSNSTLEQSAQTES